MRLWIKLLFVSVTCLIPILIGASSAIAGYIVVEVGGDARYRRGGERGPVTYGLELVDGDVLELGAGATVRVNCGSFTRRAYEGETGVSNLCGRRRARGIFRDNEPIVGLALNRLEVIAGIRSTSQIPYIISPRGTRIRTSQALSLRWNPVAEATHYTVEIYGPGGELEWEAEVSDTQVEYPGQLGRGNTYLLVVTASNGTSSLDEEIDQNNLPDGDEQPILYENANMLGLGFIWAETTTRDVEQELQQIRGRDLSTESEGLEIANLYAEYELFTDSIAVLESLENNPSFLRSYWLGRLYGHIGLSLESITYLEQAVEMAADSPKNLVSVQTTLASVYAGMENDTEANQWLDQAIETYAGIVDSRSQIEAAYQIGKAQSLAGNIEAARRWLNQAQEGYKGLLESLGAQSGRELCPMDIEPDSCQDILEIDQRGDEVEELLEQLPSE